MTLNLLHGGLLAGGIAATAIPILIHFLMRQKPKPIRFPAFRLILNKHAPTMRRLRIRHWLLLALRAALLLLLGLALSRPTLRSSLFAFDQSAPSSAVFLFDTSLSMSYKHEGKTRLDEARERAASVLRRLSEGSEITVLESNSLTATVPLDTTMATSRMGAIEPTAGTVPLNVGLASAYRILARATRDRREVYIFSDLARSSWELQGGEALAGLAELIENGVHVHVINVGIEQPVNIGLSAIDLPRQTLPANSDLELAIGVKNDGPPEDRVLELIVDDQPRDTRRINLPAGERIEATFTIPALDVGLHQGRLSMATGDNMPFDDVRYFSVMIHPPIRALVVADDTADTLHWVAALDPFRERQRPRYLIDVMTTEQAKTVDFAPYQAVAFLNVAGPTPETWLKLLNYVHAGGGLFIGLGSRATAAAYGSDVAQNVLPAKLIRVEKPPADIVLAPRQFTHPILARFQTARDALTAEMANNAVLEYWMVEPRSDAATVIPYSNGAPALLERTFGRSQRGRVLLFTTAAHYRPESYWTEFPRSWAYLAMVNQMSRHLAGIAEVVLNYTAGQNASLDLNPAEPIALLALSAPDGQVERMTVDPKESMVVLPPARMVGHYRLQAAESGSKFLRGFSVNAMESESDLTPVATDDLLALLGPERATVTRDPDSLTVAIDESRIGRELFPWIVTLVVIALAAESYVANRFHGPEAVPT